MLKSLALALLIVGTGSAPIARPPIAPRLGIAIMRCHMDECGWADIQSVETIQSGPTYRLVQVRSRNGVSSHPLNESSGSNNYPDRYSASVPIVWEAEPDTSYVLCSTAQPAVVFSGDQDSYIGHVLNLFALFGFAESSAYFYLRVCHGLEPDALEDATVRALGYRDTGETDQIDLHTPYGILERLPR